LPFPLEPLGLHPRGELLRDLLCFALGLIVGIVAMLLARL